MYQRGRKSKWVKEQINVLIHRSIAILDIVDCFQLDAFKKNGNYKDAKTIWDANSQEKDHEEMEDSKNRHNNYQKTMIELLKVLPNLKKYNEF